MKIYRKIFFSIFTFLIILTIVGCGPTPPPTAPSKGTISGIVKDAVSSAILETVSVTVYDSSNQSIANETTDNTGSFSVSVDAGNGYRIQFSKTGYISENYYGVNVQASTTTYLESVLQIDNAHSGTGNVSGKIVDATVYGGTTGVSGVTVNIRPGINSTTGTITATTNTDGSGDYYFNNLDAGTYTAELSKTGWVTTYFSIISIGGETINNQNGSISPVISEGQTRIILTWGATPSDLDSHLTGPLAPGDTTSFLNAEAGRFHIYFSNMSYEYNSTTYTSLDVDDTSSYGPETTTIYVQNNTGVYRYSVYDFTNGGSTTSTALSNSGAQVKVYREGSLVRTFNVPTGQTGTLWTVFELTGNTIAPVNTITNHSGGSGAVQNVSNQASDAQLMGDFSKK